MDPGGSGVSMRSVTEFWVYFTGRVEGFLDELGVGYEEREDSRMTPRVLAWATGLKNCC